MTEVIPRSEVLRGQAEQISGNDLYGPATEAKVVHARKLLESPGFHLIDGGGVAVVRTGAEADSVDLCLQDRAEWSDTTEKYRLHPIGKTRDGGKLFAGAVDAVDDGRPYGFQVSGVYKPPYHLYDPNNLLLDQYARRIDFHARSGNKYEPFPERPYAIATKQSSELSGDRQPNINPAKRVIYETHLKGLTMLHGGVPEELRGTYAGAARPEVTKYLKELGVTSVEFLPLQQSVSESLYEPGRLPNYWGYNTIGFFAPHGAYASVRGRQVAEFKKMVKAYHAAGLEVILDVVYNHTGEGGAGGPILSFKGYDNAGMYRINRAGNYEDYTGCGNTFDVSRPPALKVVMDSLRFWVREMHVDGFRFDLMTALTRDRYGNIDMNSPFMRAMQRDLVLKKSVIIPEPWDATWGSKRVEEYKDQRRLYPWDDGVRDVIRGAWNDRGADINGLSWVLADPKKSVKFVTAHDGFTLRDVVTYDRKHNEPNGEGNRDGETHNNRSNNHGFEGETNDPTVRSERIKAAANMLCTLLLADGTPMLRGGDELWQTQNGINNAYCQDNEISWLHWNVGEEGLYIHDLVKTLLRIRRENDRLGDISWLNVWGNPMQKQEWHNGVEVFGMHRAARKIGRDILFYVNRMHMSKQVSLPHESKIRGTYVQLIHTGANQITFDKPPQMPEVFDMLPLSVRILRRA